MAKLGEKEKYVKRGPSRICSMPSEVVATPAVFDHIYTHPSNAIKTKTVEGVTIEFFYGDARNYVSCEYLSYNRAVDLIEELEAALQTWDKHKATKEAQEAELKKERARELQKARAEEEKRHAEEQDRQVAERDRSTAKGKEAGSRDGKETRQRQGQQRQQVRHSPAAKDTSTSKQSREADRAKGSRTKAAGVQGKARPVPASRGKKGRKGVRRHAV